MNTEALQSEYTHIITGKAKLAGVCGFPLSHSKSPLIHNYWLNQNNIDGLYLPLEITPDKFNKTIKVLQQLKFKGLNVTAPNKEAAYKICDTLSNTAQAIGSVNTLVFKEDNSIFGDSSDGYGFSAPLNEYNFAISQSSALIIGAGGSARAIIYELIQKNITKIFLANRTITKAQKLLNELNLSDNIEVTPLDKHIEKILPHIDILINTTTLGADGYYNFPFKLQNLNPQAIVYDILYNPKYTQLLQKAKQQGNPILNGEKMLAYQAVVGFSYWFKYRPQVTPQLLKLISQ